MVQDNWHRKKDTSFVYTRGPGGNSCAVVPDVSLLGDVRPVIFYDQLGSGRSDKPTDTTLW